MSLLRLGGDVDGVEPADTTEESWPELTMFSWVRRVWKAWTALRWKESSGCAVLLASVSFEVGAVWRDGRDGMDPLYFFISLDTTQWKNKLTKRTDDVGVPQ